ncbi:protein-L-isoaspartate O-methyltransferase [Streptomyces sp. NPDC101151]|uniref:protein-L-isoaspartate O-methyltransferase family protein n=1 Tax=Streptomyces sp. NPDC101151 TaxID=3366115 RepID=UPI003809DD26
MSGGWGTWTGAAARRRRTADEVASAYRGRPVPLPHGQVTAQPSLIAMMVSALGLTGDEQVLEVGTGYGWQTALPARSAAYVVSVERRPDLVDEARLRLARQGIGNAAVVLGDGTRGMPPRADPCPVRRHRLRAFPRVPEPLADQLRTGGRLVQPIGQGGQERVELYERRAHNLAHRRTVTVARFVRLYGAHGYDQR